MSNWERNFERRPVRTGTKFGVVAVLGLVVISTVGGIGFGAINLLSQPARAIQKTFDADNMIYNYEWFRTQYADIQSMDAKLTAVTTERDNLSDALGTDRSTWANSDRDRWNFLSSQITGLQNQRTTMVAAYNGNASKANRSIFMAGLPATVQ